MDQSEEELRDELARQQARPMFGLALGGIVGMLIKLFSRRKRR